MLDRHFYFLVDYINSGRALLQYKEFCLILLIITKKLTLSAELKCIGWLQLTHPDALYVLQSIGRCVNNACRYAMMLEMTRLC